MKKFIVGLMTLAMIMATSFTASAVNYYNSDECTYAQGEMAQGLITGVAISDVGVYGDMFSLGGLSVDMIALQGMTMETGAINDGGICGSDLNLNQNISIVTDTISIQMNQTGIASSTRTCGYMMER